MISVRRGISPHEILQELARAVDDELADYVE